MSRLRFLESQLLPFDSVKSCSKCGGEQLFFQYKPSVNSIDARTILIPEYLIVKCGRCGYQQFTKTKDSSVQTATDITTR